jgi:hypothetical protein
MQKSAIKRRSTFRYARLEATIPSPFHFATLEVRPLVAYNYAVAEVEFTEILQV